MIDRYLSNVEASLKALRPLIANDTIAIERPEGIPLAYLTGRITFIDGSQLAVAEIVSPSNKAYRFHYMDQQHRRFPGGTALLTIVNSKPFPFTSTPLMVSWSRTRSRFLTSFGSFMTA